MPDTTWKAAERAIARFFSTERTGPRGENWPDCISASYAIEVKHRKTFPAWLKDAIAQARTNGATHAPDKLAIVVLHEAGTRYDECPVIVTTLRDWIEWFGE